jgi:hypothetical protein
MRSLLDLDKAQLHRIEHAIAELGALPVLERQKKICLIQALKSQKQELIRCNPAIRLVIRFKAAA